MRRLALALLMLNILYVLWAALRPAPVPAVSDGPSAGEVLVLLEEIDRPVPAVTQAPAVCAVLGPFASEGDLLAFADAQLSGRDWQMSVDEQALPLMYRVYVPPADAELAGAALLASVRDAIAGGGFAIDSYLVVGGDLDGMVSLGLFAEPDNARRVYDQISGLGVAAEMRTEERIRNLYSIVFRADEDSDFIQESVAALQAVDAGSGITEKLCEMIALPD
ncbi:hypothetical protein [Pseudohongiella sp.]|uniref:SPOR domain-containing protein n=1 Tax=marine sediment metagenome TaxID=412755 RepID=A0A0F9R297_9ZZZZ|nr:hypothetical protein [Pseudohongiella sp.]HDZ08253.1 hypothetical protein [Pseudohongiella sp.]HEA63693.1 hypothetical protein [Pseudohongiella sp.]